MQLISDEIYHGIEYAPLDGDARWRAAPGRPAARRWSSPASRKYFSMTGWRIGWMLVPDRLRRAVRRADRQLHDLPAGARAARLPRGVRRRVVRRARRPRRGATPTTAGCCSTGCRGSASPSSRRPTARSTSTPTSATSPTTRWRSATTCWPAPASRWRRASTSTPRSGTGSCGSASPGDGGRHRGGAGAALHSALTARFRSTARGPGRSPACTATPRRSAGWPAPCATRARRCASEADRLLARAEAVPWEGLAADAMRARVRAQVGGAAAHRRAGRRRRRRPRPARRRGGPAQGADRRDRAEGDGAGRRREGPARPGWSTSGAAATRSTSCSTGSCHRRRATATGSLVDLPGLA